jgi:hydrogenase/urease accessory protein HupE
MGLKVRSEALMGVSALFRGVFSGPAACFTTNKAPFVVGFAILTVSPAIIAIAITASKFAAVIAAEPIVSAVTFVCIVGVFFMAEFAVELIRIIINSQLFSLAAFPDTNSGSEL